MRAVLIENAFTVAAPADFLWAYLLDVEKIAPCLPGAELTEVVDDRNWKGKVSVKLGPVAMAFAGSVAMQERDDDAHRVVLAAKGMEQRGKGAASATVTSWLEPGPDGTTTVRMRADITLTGTAAQLSRGLLPEVSKKLTQQFADCLQAGMTSERRAEVGEAEAAAARPGPGAAAPAAAPSPPPPAKPVSGIRLGLSALWSLVVSFFKRVFGRGG